MLDQVLLRDPFCSCFEKPMVALRSQSMVVQPSTRAKDPNRWRFADDELLILGSVFTHYAAFM